MVRKLKKPKISQVLFGIVGIISLISGMLYILRPIAPYHPDIIGMSYETLVTTHPQISGLITTLVDVIGFTFLALAGLFFHIGSRAWKERKSQYSILIILIAMFIPVTFLVYSIGGPTSVMVSAVVLTAGGLISSHFEESENH